MCAPFLEAVPGPFQKDAGQKAIQSDHSTAVIINNKFNQPGKHRKPSWIHNNDNEGATPLPVPRWQGFGLSPSVLCPWCLEQCLAHSRCLGNTSAMTVNA